MTTPSTDDPVTVGPYRVTGRLGAGGMGQVYLGASRGGRAVAIKVVRPALAGDPHFRERFRAEIAAARAVSGAFTTPVVDADPDATMPWLATAYVPGPSLQDAVDSHGAMPEDSLRTLGAGVAEALVAIHRAGLIHRDLKPSNILLAADGPRVIDFGISRTVDGTALTAAGQVIGSAGYIPPEQAGGRPPSSAGDVFSLGAVLAFAATGRPPFGTGPLPVLLFRATHEEPRLDGVPVRMVAVIARCLAKDPDQRPRAEELPALLAPAPYGTPWLPEPITREVRERESTVVRTLAAPRSRPFTRRRVLIAGGTLAAGGVAAGTGLWISRDEHPGSPRPLWSASLPASDMGLWEDRALPGPLHYSSDAAVIALDPENGHEVWRDSGAYEALPTLDGSRRSCLVVRDGKLRALDGATGRERWSYAPPGADAVKPTSQHAVITRGDVVILERMPAKRVYALDLRHGTLRWTYSGPGGQEVGWATGDTSERYFLCRLGSVGDDSVACLDPASGRPRWSLSKTPWAVSTMTTAGTSDLFFAFGTNRDLFAIRPGDGTVRWRIAAAAIAAPSGTYRHPDLSTVGRTLILAGNDRLRGVDIDAGRVLWTRTAPESSGAVEPHGPMGYYVAGGAVLAVDLRTGRVQRTVARPPAQAGLLGVAGRLLLTGTVDISGRQGGLHAWDLRSGELLWHHPVVTDDSSRAWGASIIGDRLFASYAGTAFAFGLPSS